MVETAKVWLSLLVDDAVGADISALSESPSTDLTVVRSLASVTPLMSLRKILSLTKARNLAYENLLSNSQIEKSYVPPQPDSLQG
jgi:hypothetical protein